MAFLIFTSIAVGLILSQVLLQKFFGNQIRSIINGIGLIIALFWLFKTGNNNEQNVDNFESKKIENTTKGSANSLYSNQNIFSDKSVKTTQEKKRVDYIYSSKVYNEPIKKVQTHEVRIGAICNDGTVSNATGSGACSHHGGVAYWLIE